MSNAGDGPRSGTGDFLYAGCVLPPKKRSFFLLYVLFSLPQVFDIPFCWCYNLKIEYYCFPAARVRAHEIGKSKPGKCKADAGMRDDRHPVTARNANIPTGATAMREMQMYQTADARMSDAVLP